MTNKKIKIGISVAVVLASLYLLYQSDLFNVVTSRGKFKSPENSHSEMSFKVKNGDTRTIKLNSRVKEGELSIAIEDMDANIIAQFESNKKYSEKISFSQAGEYRLVVKRLDFIGNHIIKIR